MSMDSICNDDLVRFVYEIYSLSQVVILRTHGMKSVQVVYREVVKCLLTIIIHLLALPWWLQKAISGSNEESFEIQRMTYTSATLGRKSIMDYPLQWDPWYSDC